MEEIDEINDFLETGEITDFKEESDFIVYQKLTTDGYAVYVLKPSKLDDSEIDMDKHIFSYLPSSQIADLLLKGNKIFIGEIEEYYPLIQEIHSEIL